MYNANAQCCAGANGCARVERGACRIDRVCCATQ
jgi:hypothetical protein